MSLSATLLSWVCLYSLSSSSERFVQLGIYHPLCPFGMFNLVLFSMRSVNLLIFS